MVNPMFFCTPIFARLFLHAYFAPLFQVTPGESGATQAHPVLGIIITCLVLINVSTILDIIELKCVPVSLRFIELKRFQVHLRF